MPCQKIELAAETKLIIFYRNKGSIWIDFVKHEIDLGVVYIIPKWHFYYMEVEQTDFHIVSIDEVELDTLSKYILYRTKYKNTPIESIVAIDVFQTQLAVRNDSLFIRNVMPQYLLSDGIAYLKSCPRVMQTYVELVGDFLSYIHTQGYVYANISMAQYAAINGNSERTINRACLMLFGLTAKQIVRYHMVNRSIYMIVSSFDTINEISSMLGFNDISNFSRFVKSTVGVSPTEIRYNFLTA
ncbi:MAG: AraC family transcriptional regulator [Sphingobacteriales bacterium]|nr:MAG: AraC family transcriptional regulator [Sphingobacteriales bacterium]